ncbi:MAG: hypothetical protein FWD88_03200 [Treponema sp.]|nr:hypothetical protein [Treponema sp.]
MTARFTPVFAVMLMLAVASCSMPESDTPKVRPYDPCLDSWRTASWIPFCVADTITGFAYGNGRYVAVSSTGRIGWSGDGDRWFLAEITSPVSNFNSVVFGNGVFVAVGNGGRFANSLDGERWVARDSMNGFDGYDITGVAWGAGNFVAVGGRRRMPMQGGGYSPGSPRIAYSATGIDWSGGIPWGFVPERLNDVAFGDGRFFVVGDRGNRGWSRNPVAGWQHRGPAAPIHSQDITRVAVGSYGPGTGVGVVFGDGRTAIATNPEAFADWDADLRTFLFYLPPIPQTPWNRPRAEMIGITYAAGYFVTAGTGAMIGWWPSAEPSRISERFWRALTFPEFMLWEITTVAALNGRFFVGNVGGRIAHSGGAN